MRSTILLSILLVSFLSCEKGIETTTTLNTPEISNPWGLKDYSDIPKAQIMVVGSYHFAQENKVDELSSEVQAELQKIRDALAEFNPDKVFLEKEPELTERYNEAYTNYINNQLDIDTLRPNETLQLGFKLARQLNHDRVYLFDNQTEFIGSLEGFSFEGFNQYAEANDSGFFDRHIETISSSFQYNDSILNTLPLYERFQAMNSDFMSRVNFNRMHSYEIRVGISQNWLGPDWLGRYYRRNIRMASIVMKELTPSERGIIIVGDNHKWVLDILFDGIPELEVIKVGDYLE